MGLYLLVLNCFGCTAAFSGKQLPVVNSLPGGFSAWNRPTVYLDVNVYGQALGIHDKPFIDLMGKENFVSVLENVTEETEIFGRYTFDRMRDRFRPEEMDYTLKIELLNYTYTGSTKRVMLWIGAISLNTIPVRNTSYYRLTATLIDRDGTKLGTYEFEDHITIWQHVIFAPLLNFRLPNFITRDVWENMIRTLYRAIIEDGLVEIPSVQTSMYPVKGISSPK
jgi:hypothetical protein